MAAGFVCARAVIMNHNGLTADTSSRRDIDKAIGVLVGLRRCSERQAFNEIAAGVNETGIGLGSLCRALVTLAGGTTSGFEHSSAVVDRWGELVDERETHRVPAEG